MKILVDADACPVKDIIVQQAALRGIEVVMVCDTAHRIDDGYSRVLVVDKGADMADIKIANLVCPKDIVVTQDYGVASMALGKGAFALSQNGLEYTAQNIERLLFERFLGKKSRQAGIRTHAVKKRTRQDDQAFLQAFVRLLEREEKECV